MFEINFAISLQRLTSVVAGLIFISLFHFKPAFASNDLDILLNDDNDFPSTYNSKTPHHFLTNELGQNSDSPDIYPPAQHGNNIAFITQIGSENQARINQTGSYNNAAIAQHGNQNEADISQIGFANRVEQTQLGNFNSVTASQFGNHNSIEQIQLGNGLHSNITQVGNYKSIRIIQGY